MLTRIRHNQLKNFISTKDQNVIYYASDYEVFSLNVATRKRTLIKSLPFQPFCLDAGYGWICAGGDKHGQCAFISIDEPGNGETALRHHAEVDDLLPLDLDAESRRSLHDLRRTTQWGRYLSGTSPKYELQTHELGGTIVNSVRVHLICSEEKGFKDEVVVVITNNDQTVRIFSLTQSRLLETLDFPTPMNHASISPDGKLLLAVGDEGRAFFCRRMRLPGATTEGENSYARYEWHEVAEPELTLADEEGDACFTTAFSPSGHICGVASQSGTITLFDTALIHDDMDPDDAVIDVLRSSRASMRPHFVGAVRSMCFSPAPWDLLAWAEDQGRVCVVDLRNGFYSKQVIELETDSPDLNRADVEDLDTTSEQRQLEIERRFVERHREALEAQDHLAAVSHTADYLELAAARRRLEREALDATPQDLSALTETERQLVDSIGLRRMPGSHHGSSDTSPSGPISVNYTPTRSTDSHTWTGLPSPTPSSNLQSRSTASIHEFMRQRNWERSRASDRSYQPRRRSSVIISNSNSHSNNPSPQPSSSLAPIGTATPTLSASPSRLPASSADSAVSHLHDADPWQTITDAMGASNMPPDTIARLRSLQSRNLERSVQARAVPQATIDRRMQALQGAREQTMATHADAVEARVNRAREANVRALRQSRASRADIVYDEIDREFFLRRLDEPRRRLRSEDAVTTMGIGWSPEGRNL